MKFANQVVWITGASQGLGEALAYAFRREGARLVLSARSVDLLEKVRANCPGDLSEVIVLPLDLDRTEELAGKAREALAAFGRIDVLVNNAAFGTRGKALDIPVGIDEEIMRVNFLGPVALTKAVLPGMIERKRGRIVVISSVSGKIATPGNAAYSASKHALHGFYDSLRAELWKEGIRVTMVLPGFVRTNISINARRADGTKVGKMDRHHASAMSADKAAAIIVDGVAKGKEEVHVGRESLALYINRLSPGLVRWGVRRFRL